MPGIPDQVIDEIRHQTDIVELIESYLPLKRRGADYWGCCPFHNEKSPSFKVSSHRQAYYCFGCKKSGSAFNFVMERENVDFVGAVRFLAQRCGVTIPEEGDGPDATLRREARQMKERLYDLLKTVATWYRQLLLHDPAAAVARDYLQNRGIPAEFAQTFGIGYAPAGWEDTLEWARRLKIEPELLLGAGLLVQREDGSGYDRFRGRLMFPICDDMGRCVGFSGRVLEADAKGAKYVNTPETELFKKGKLLYALHLARTQFKTHGFALICEGQLDVLACHRAGLANAVAPQGTAFTEQQAAMLKRFTEDVVFCFDADIAGEKATLASLELAFAAGLRAKVASLAGDGSKEDPDSFLRKYGAEALGAKLRGGVDALAYVVQIGRQRFGGDTPTARSQTVELALPILAKIPNPVLRASYGQWLARELELPESSVLGMLTEEQNREHRQQLGRRAATAPPPERVAPTEGAPAATPEGKPAVPPTRRAAPRRAMADFRQKTEAMLLDIALRDQTSARRIAATLPHDTLGDSAVGRALNTVIALTEEGEWEHAGTFLLQDPDLIGDSEVGRVMISAEFTPPVALETADAADNASRHQEYERRVQRALDDCLGNLEAESVKRQIAAAQRQLVEEQDPEKISELSLQLRELNQKRATLSRAR